VGCKEGGSVRIGDVRKWWSQRPISGPGGSWVAGGCLVVARLSASAQLSIGHQTIHRVRSPPVSSFKLAFTIDRPAEIRNMYKIVHGTSLHIDTCTFAFGRVGKISLRVYSLILWTMISQLTTWLKPSRNKAQLFIIRPTTTTHE
jgi:hypothetical protein